MGKKFHKKQVQQAKAAPLPAFDPKLLNQMLQKQAPQAGQTGVLNPGVPIQPYAGITPAGGPRQWSYLIGQNITTNDRTQGNRETPSFRELRNLARAYEGITLNEQVLYNLISKLTLEVKLRPEVANEGRTEQDFQKEMTQYKRFFEKPDRTRDLHSWLRMAVREQTQLDALPIFLHKNNFGGLWGLEIVAGDTIKPILDDRGMTPVPPYPAYQQYVYEGTPGDWYTTEQMCYIQESPQADSAYGFSRVERIVYRVRQALRKEAKDLAKFTDGNIPAGMLELAADGNWTADQIVAYQQMFDALLAGNYALQSRIRVMPPGSKYTQIDEAGLESDFDKFLINICCASYGTTMADLSFTESVNLANGEAQEDVLYRRALNPITKLYENFFTQILVEFFNEDRFLIQFGGFEEPEDLGALAIAYKTFYDMGSISPSEVAKRMNFPVPCEVPPYIVVQGAGIILNEHIAAMGEANLQKAQHPPQPVAPHLALPAASAEPLGIQAQGQEDPQEEQPAPSSAEERDAAAAPLQHLTPYQEQVAARLKAIMLKGTEARAHASQ